MSDALVQGCHEAGVKAGDLACLAMGELRHDIGARL